MQFLEAGKDKERDSSLEPPEGTQPCWYLNFRPSDLLNYMINLCYFKPLSLWSFVTAAVGNLTQLPFQKGTWQHVLRNIKELMPSDSVILLLGLSPVKQSDMQK